MLTLKNVEVIYDDVILVLKGLSLEVPEGRIVALLGPNGAGKTTTLKAISGLLHAEEGEVTDGTIELDGERIERLAPEEIVRRGIFQVMEGRRVFEDLTVDENITMGGYTRGDRAACERDREICFEYFPQLKELRKNLAGYLSGGEQQMLAISRALMARPKLILLDEPSLGLAPLVVRQIFGIIARINARGEDRPSSSSSRTPAWRCRWRTTATSWRAVASSSTAARQARSNEDVKEFYLGGGAGGRELQGG